MYSPIAKSTVNVKPSRNSLRRDTGVPSCSSIRAKHAIDAAHDDTVMTMPRREKLTREQIRTLLNALMRAPVEVVQDVGFLAMTFVSVVEVDLPLSSGPSGRLGSSSAVVTPDARKNALAVVKRAKSRRRDFGREGGGRERYQMRYDEQELLRRWAVRNNRNVPRLLSLLRQTGTIGQEGALLVRHHAHQISAKTAEKALSAAADVLAHVRRAADDTVNKLAETKGAVARPNAAAIAIQRCWHRCRLAKMASREDTLFAATEAAKTAAAVRIQAFARGMTVRCATRATSIAVAPMQTCATGRRVRRRIRRIFEAAAKIQSMARDLPAAEAMGRLDLERRMLLRMQAVWRGAVSLGVSSSGRSAVDRMQRRCRSTKATPKTGATAAHRPARDCFRRAIQRHRMERRVQDIARRSDIDVPPSTQKGGTPRRSVSATGHISTEKAAVRVFQASWHPAVAKMRHAADKKSAATACTWRRLAQKKLAATTREWFARRLCASIRGHGIEPSTQSSRMMSQIATSRERFWALERFRYGGKLAEGMVRLMRNIRPMRACRKLKRRKEEEMKKYMDSQGFDGSNGARLKIELLCEEDLTDSSSASDKSVWEEGCGSGETGTAVSSRYDDVQDAEGPMASREDAAYSGSRNGESPTCELPPLLPQDTCVAAGKPAIFSAHSPVVSSPGISEGGSLGRPRDHGRATTSDSGSVQSVSPVPSDEDDGDGEGESFDEEGWGSRSIEWDSDDEKAVLIMGEENEGLDEAGLEKAKKCDDRLALTILGVHPAIALAIEGDAGAAPMGGLSSEPARDNRSESSESGQRTAGLTPPPDLLRLSGKASAHPQIKGRNLSSSKGPARLRASASCSTSRSSAVGAPLAPTLEDIVVLSGSHTPTKASSDVDQYLHTPPPRTPSPNHRRPCKGTPPSPGSPPSGGSRRHRDAKRSIGRPRRSPRAASPSQGRPEQKISPPIPDLPPENRHGQDHRLEMAACFKSSFECESRGAQQDKREREERTETHGDLWRKSTDHEAALDEQCRLPLGSSAHSHQGTFRDGPLAEEAPNDNEEASSLAADHHTTIDEQRRALQQYCKDGAEPGESPPHQSDEQKVSPEDAWVFRTMFERCRALGYQPGVAEDGRSLLWGPDDVKKLRASKGENNDRDDMRSRKEYPKKKREPAGAGLNMPVLKEDEGGAVFDLGSVDKHVQQVLFDNHRALAEQRRGSQDNSPGGGGGARAAARPRAQEGGAHGRRGRLPR